MIHLHTFWYKERRSVARQRELEYALYKNLTHPEFKVHLCLEASLPSWVEKIIPKDKYATRSPHPIDRPYFSEMFTKAWAINKVLKYSGIHLFCNSDVYFDQTICKAYALQDDQALCLSRWDRIQGRWRLYKNAFQSQDAWVLREFPDPQHFSAIRFHPGDLGCDNRLAWQLDDWNYRVSNPSMTIRVYHAHNSGERFYDRKLGPVIPRPYKLVRPTEAIL